jgi:PAS domain S-box-containing protein
MQKRMAEVMTQRLPDMSFAFRIHRADGASRWIEGAARFIYDAAGSPLRMVGVNIDVTDRREAELALRDSEERLRLAADAGKVGLWDWDIVNNRIVWSDRVYDFHGLPRGSFGGRVEHFSALIHPDDRDHVGSALSCALNAGGSYEVEFRTIRPDGQVRWLSTSARVLYGSAGTPVRMFGAVLDTTERREYEERLRRSNEELEEFAFVASHDLREPLRMVNTYSEMLLRGAGSKLDPNLATCRQYIEKGVQRMEELIDDLLAYSRVIHSEYQGGMADLQRALGKALRVLEPEIAQTGATIESDVLPLVRGEETQFEQVFQNLIGNSLKYRQSETSPQIRIRVAPEKQQLRISISDNGIGFAPEYGEHVFGLFKRLHRDAYPGTGLGLAICKRIIERYGGRIWAESTPGSGSTFTFTVPLATADDVRNLPQATADQGKYV